MIFLCIITPVCFLHHEVLMKNGKFFTISPACMVQLWTDNIPLRSAIIYDSLPASGGELSYLRDLAYSRENQSGTIGEIPDHFSCGHAGKHQHRIQTGFNSSYNVGIHTVANNGRLL